MRRQVDNTMRPEILAEIPAGVYAFVGALILGNISLISGGLGIVFKHFLDHNLMKSQLAELKVQQESLKKSLDTVWDRMRNTSPRE